jgi:hypothetical protein
VTLPARIPMPGGLLADVLDDWRSRGWDPSDLGRFRMGPDDDEDEDELDELEDLGADELAALKTLSDADVKALNALTGEQRAALAAAGAVDEEKLPEAVKAILKKERTAAREASRARKAADRSARTEKERADRAEAQLAKLKKGKKDDDPDPAEVIENARREADEAATKRANRAILEARIEAAASGKLTSPHLAARLLDLDDFDVDENGKVDRKAIDEAIDELLEDNPGLSAKARPRRPKPTDKGRRGETATGADAGKAEAERRFGKTKVKQ